MGEACSTYEERRGVYRFVVGKPKGKTHLEYPDVNGMIILSYIFRKWDLGHGLD
jgi:hypothetical protein